MKVFVDTGPLAEVAADWLVVGIFEGRPLAGPLAELDSALDGLLSRLIDSKDVSGKSMEMLPVLGHSGIAAARILLVGMGNPDGCDELRLLRTATAAARQISTAPYARIAYTLIGREGGVNEVRIAETIAHGAAVGSYGQDLYLSEPRRHAFAELVVATGGVDTPANLEQAARSGEIIGRAVNLARRLINEPAARIFPASFAEVAEKIAEDSLLGCRVFDEKALAAETMQAMLAVAAGSDQPPRMVVLEHRPERLSEQAAEGPCLALVGKGVTFDSGGLSLKTAAGMETMKCDMSGAAVVLGAMQAIAELKLPVHVIGLMGLVENLPSGKAMKVGDVLRARNGVTIEVLNTDAEGRLVLADVLSYAVDQKPAHLVDLATLTGACVVALGNNVAGLMSNNQSWADRVLRAAACAGELAWQLPLFEDYAEQIRGNVGDVKNTGGRPGGAVTAGKFLERFVAGVPWVHLDIAGPAFAEKDNTWREGGGTGCMVPTLVELARNL